MMWFLSELFMLSVIDMYAASGHGFHENNSVSNSYEITCEGIRTITIVNLNVQQHSTPCSQLTKCNLTEQQINDIKKSCNEKRACDISTVIPNSCLFNEYGYLFAWYSCAAIVNSSCTFENGECGWTIKNSEKGYTWKLQTGADSTRFTGPDKDHTTASVYGHFMTTRSSKGSKFSYISDLLTGLIVSSPKQCLTFWYHMYGDDINNLKVFQLNSDHTVELWRKSDNQGNKWYFKSLELKDIGPYQIQFKATRGDGDKSDIAIDDIIITNTACKEAIDCNFETGQCGWKTEETTHKWTHWHDKTPTDDTGPDIDHTLGTSTGEYIYFEASDISEGERSNITSETVYRDGDSCFTFWYHMYGEGMGTLNVYLDSENVSRNIWSMSGNRQEKWWLGHVDISISEPYTITFEGMCGSSYKNDIALDDIVLLSGSCEEDFVLDCNFEVENCNWSTNSGTPYFWKITDTPISTDYNGPYNDHTTGSAYGHYIYLVPTSSNLKQVGIKSNLTSRNIHPGHAGGDLCFTFWYHMYGETIGTLSVYTESNNTLELHWSQSGNKVNSWQFANFDISNSETYRIIFEGVSGDDTRSDIALDDIVLHHRSCSAFVKDCNFEVATCYWSNYPEMPYIWTITETPISKEGNGPHYDHTTGSADGHYLYLHPDGLKSVKYQLTSLTISLTGDICFTFWYHMYGTDIGTLSVYTESNNTTHMHWSQSGNQGKFWQFASFDISKSEPFRIVFEGIRGDNDGSDISLDDMLLLQRSCSGSINYSQQCHHMDASITLAECSNYYLQLDKTSLVFNPYYDDCSSNYQEIQTSIINQCDNLENSKICSFNLSDVIKKGRKCYQSNRLLIEYRCEDETTTVSSRKTSKDDSNAGLIVGLVIGGLVLTCAVICIVVFVKRQTSASGSKEKMRDTNSEHDYIGCQDIALPQTADHTSHMQYADKQTSNDEEYAFSDPTAETSSKGSIDDTSRPAELKDTDFNRTTCSNSFTGYECAHVVTGNKIGDDHQYAISNEGFYDHSGNNRNKEPENSIYDHAVDTVYDSGSHNRNNERKEDTYDHFFGEKTEDDYDVSIPT